MKTINESINKAYSYIRFSSKKQELGDSLRRQLQSAQAYCTRNGLQLNSSSYRDLGVSAFKGLNTQEDNGLGQFLTACSTGRIQSGDYLLVESLDRMSRQHVQTALRQFLNILSYGVTIVTLLDNRSYTIQSDTTDLIISITIMARAYEESATKSKRLKSAWDNKRTRLQDGSATTYLVTAHHGW
jgi:DNA invertase Pin-like site-specific DNA recombinase